MTDTRTQALKPCPFCGNDGSGPIEEALHISMQEHSWRDTSWTVQCDKCTATMGYSDSEDAAAEAWNTRTGLNPDAIADVVAALRGLMTASKAVSRLGATTGPQWVGLTSAYLKAQAALAKLEAQS